MTLDNTYQHILKTCKTIVIKDIISRLLIYKTDGLALIIQSLRFDHIGLIHTTANRALHNNIKSIIQNEVQYLKITGMDFLDILINNPTFRFAISDDFDSIIEKYYLERVCDDLTKFKESTILFNHLLELITGRNISTFTNDELEQGGDAL